jgi:glycosyltransferase involved in cell wall biosynthesis
MADPTWLISRSVAVSFRDSLRIRCDRCGSEKGPACDRALVSIGMPVYNEERHVAQALESLLAQEYEKLEIIICDNASQDGTEKVCLQYASRDPRVRYCRNQSNLGAIENWNRAFKLSKGQYFAWAAGHDVWERTYISRCVELLERDKSIVLCYTQSVHIDSKGNRSGTVHTVIDTRGLTASQRFLSKLWGIGLSSFCVYGVIRSSALRRTRLFRNTLGPDDILLSELCFLGDLVGIPEELIFFRVTRDCMDPAEDVRRYFETLGVRRRLPYWGFICENCLVVARAPVGHREKLLLMVNVLVSYLRLFRIDMLFAISDCVRGIEKRSPSRKSVAGRSESN